MSGKEPVTDGVPLGHGDPRRPRRWPRAAAAAASAARDKHIAELRGPSESARTGSTGLSWIPGGLCTNHTSDSESPQPGPFMPVMPA